MTASSTEASPPERTVVVAYDPGGAALAEAVVLEVEALGFVATTVEGSGRADYPSLALKACAQLLHDRTHSAILMCGTGVGMSIAANKVDGIRAARCTDPYSTERARRSNDANVLTFGGEVLGPAAAAYLVRIWLSHEFDSKRSIPKVKYVAEIERNRGTPDRG